MRRQTLLIFALAAALVVTVSGCTDVRTITESEVIPFETIKREDPSLMVGQTKVIQPGDQGLRTVVFEDTYRWGKKLSRKKVEVDTVFKPAGAIVNVGTKKAITLAVQTAAGAYEINVTAAARQPSYLGGRTINDAVVLKGSIKNTGAKPGRTGGATDLALIHPALQGGVIFLPATPVATVGPGESINITWVASVNGGKPGVNAALSGLKELKVTARAHISPQNGVVGEAQPINGLPSI